MTDLDQHESEYSSEGLDNELGPQLPLLVRPARFWQGASIPFQILESIYVLETEVQIELTDGQFWENVGIVHDVQLVLDKVVQYTEHLNIDDVSKLKILFERFREDVYRLFPVKLKAMGLMRPAYPLTTKSVHIWFTSIKKSIQLSNQIIQDIGLRDDVKALEETLAARHLDYRQHLDMDNTLKSSQLAAWELETRHSLPGSVAFGALSITDISTNVKPAFESLVQHYRNWCRWATADQLTVANLLPQLQDIRTVLAGLLHPNNSKSRTLRDRGLDLSTEILYAGWHARFVSKFIRAVQQNLDFRCSKFLASLSTAEKHIDSEYRLCKLVQHLKLAAFPTVDHVDMEEWDRLVPRMLNLENYSFYVNQLQACQDKMRVSQEVDSEIQRLWYSLWRSLKTTYVALEKLSFDFPDISFIPEKQLLDNIVVQRMCRTILGQPEVLNPVIIENIVTMYCISIARSQHQQGSMMQNLRGDTAVGSRVFTIIADYNQAQIWSIPGIFAMRKLAVRLNFLLRGPAYVRRVSQARVWGSWALDKIPVPKAPDHPVDDTDEQLLSIGLSASMDLSLAHRKDPSQINYSDIFDQKIPDDPTIDSNLLNIPTTSLPPAYDHRHTGQIFLAEGKLDAAANSDRDTRIMVSFDCPSIGSTSSFVTERLNHHNHELTTRDGTLANIRRGSSANIVHSTPEATPGSNWTDVLQHGPLELARAMWNKFVRPNRSLSFKGIRSGSTSTRPLQRHVVKNKQKLLPPITDLRNRVGKTKLREIKLKKIMGFRPIPDIERLFRQRVEGFWSEGEEPDAVQMRARFLEPVDWQLDVAVQMAFEDAYNLEAVNKPCHQVSGQNVPAISSQDGQSPQVPIHFDPLTPSAPIIDPSVSSTPVGNQQHQAQIDADRRRRDQGLPPNQRDDNSSSQENHKPQGRFPLRSLSPGSEPEVFVCPARACHICPKYANQYHHICPSLKAISTVVNGSNTDTQTSIRPQNSNDKSQVSSSLSSVGSDIIASFAHDLPPTFYASLKSNEACPQAGTQGKQAVDPISALRSSLMSSTSIQTNPAPQAGQLSQPKSSSNISSLTRQRTSTQFDITRRVTRNLLSQINNNRSAENQLTVDDVNTAENIRTTAGADTSNSAQPTALAHSQVENRRIILPVTPRRQIYRTLLHDVVPLNTDERNGEVLTHERREDRPRRPGRWGASDTGSPPSAAHEGNIGGVSDDIDMVELEINPYVSQPGPDPEVTFIDALNNVRVVRDDAPEPPEPPAYDEDDPFLDPPPVYNRPLRPSLYMNWLARSRIPLVRPRSDDDDGSDESPNPKRPRLNLTQGPDSGWPSNNIQNITTPSHRVWNPTRQDRSVLETRSLLSRQDLNQKRNHSLAKRRTNLEALQKRLADNPLKKSSVQRKMKGRKEETLLDDHDARLLKLREEMRKKRRVAFADVATKDGDN